VAERHRDLDGNGSINEADRVNWQAALQYCDRLELAGHSDWRLPNVRELQSIVHYGRYNSCIDPVFRAVPDGYWTSSLYTPVPNHSWYINFFDGHVLIYNGETYFFRVRAVRGGL